MEPRSPPSMGLEVLTPPIEITASPSALPKKHLEATEPLLPDQPVRPVSTLCFPLSILASMVFGIGCIMSQKQMNRVKAPRCADETNPACAEEFFSSPLIQLWFGAIGACLCWCVYAVDAHGARVRGERFAASELLMSQQSMQKPQAGYAIWILPAAFEFIASWLCNLAMSVTFASTVLLLRTFNTATVALITTVWFRAPLRVHHWSGVLVITMGTIIGSIFALLHQDPNTPFTPQQTWFGVAAALTSCIFTSLKVCTEERFLKSYRISPLKAAGIQGVYHLIVATSSILYFYGFDPRTREPTAITASLHQLKSSKELQSWSLVFCCCIFAFNASLVIISKLGSSLLRTVLHAFRTVLVYLLEVALGWSHIGLLDSISVVTSTTGLLLYTNAIPFKGSEIVVTGLDAKQDPDVGRQTTAELGALNTESQFAP